MDRSIQARSALFGGALLYAGLTATGAVAQELVPDPAHVGSGGVTLYAYRCFNDQPVGECDSYASFGTTLFTTGSFGGEPDVAVGDHLFAVESTPTRFALTRSARPADRPADYLWVDRAYTYAYFIVTDDAVIEYDFDYGFAGSAQAWLRIGDATFGTNSSGSVPVEAGTTVQIEGRAEMPDVSFSVTVQPRVCNNADIAPPFGVFDLSDVNAFIDAFLVGGSLADFTAPFGVIDLADVDRFIADFLAGCP